MSGEINSYRLSLYMFLSVLLNCDIIFVQEFSCVPDKKNHLKQHTSIISRISKKCFFNYTVRVSKWSFFSLGNFSQSAENRKLTIFYKIHSKLCPGADPRFQVRGAHLTKLRRAEGCAKMLGVFRVINHDFTPKNHFFSNCKGGGVSSSAAPLDPPLMPSLFI